MRTLIRLCLLIIAAFICSLIFSSEQTALAQDAPLANCTVCISEFRTRGTSATDEFIELYNNTDADIDINGFKVTRTTSTGGTTTTVRTISAVAPATTVMLPARGHFLVANDTASPGGYSLTTVASPDRTYTTDIPDSNSLEIREADNDIRDRVGFTTTALKEGTGLAQLSAGSAGASNQYSYVRRVNTSTNRPQDTGDNATDFVLVVADASTNILSASVLAGSTPKYGTQKVTLGAPGPENLSSPIESDASFTGVLYDNTKTAAQSPNRCYDSAAGGGAVGSLFIRRNVTNNTATTFTQLRIRVVDITTATANPDPATGKAIIKPMTSTGTGTPVTCPIPGGATLQATTLDVPPSVANNGGLNSTLSTTPIPAGTSVNIEYRLAADRTGTFTYLFIYEAK